MLPAGPICRGRRSSLLYLADARREAMLPIARPLVPPVANGPTVHPTRHGQSTGRHFCYGSLALVSDCFSWHLLFSAQRPLHRPGSPIVSQTPPAGNETTEHGDLL